VRIALLSDIHGNCIALDAVLADARRLGAEAYWILGDLVALGTHPVETLERLTELPNASFVRGNTDRYVVTGERPPVKPLGPGDDRDLDAIAREIEASFSWTTQLLRPTRWLAWLADLELEQRRELPDGSRLLGVHASPGTDDGEGIHPGQSNAELRELTAGCDAEIVCTGHTHQPVNRQLGNLRAVNLGCVSNPLGPDLRASYVVLQLDSDAVHVEHRRVPYDHTKVLAAIHASNHPAADFLASFQRGVHQPRPPHPDDRRPITGR